MDTLLSLIIELLGNLIWLILGAILLRLFTLIKDVFPNRVLWRIGNPKKVVICASNSTRTYTGQYTRPATGIGQVVALSIIGPSLHKTYGALDYGNIYLSNTQLNEKLEDDLILLGSPKTNQVSERYLNLMKDLQPAYQIGNKILWRKKNNNVWDMNNAEEFCGEIVKGKVQTDYAIIMRTRSPFTSKARSVILLAGSHTFGTMAAAKFFNDMPLHFLKNQKMLVRRNFILLVSAQVVNDYPTSIKLVKHFQW